MEELKIFKDKAIAAYNKASKEGKELLSDLFGKSICGGKITDRIKNMQDVCAEIGRDYNQEFGHEAIKNMSEDEVAYREAKYIAKAYNEGVLPDFNNPSQRKYYPYMSFSGRGLSLLDVRYDYSTTDVAPCLCFVSEELCRAALSQFLDTYKTFYKNNTK